MAGLHFDYARVYTVGDHLLSFSFGLLLVYRICFAAHNLLSLSFEQKQVDPVHTNEQVPVFILVIALPEVAVELRVLEVFTDGL